MVSLRTEKILVCLTALLLVGIAGAQAAAETYAGQPASVPRAVRPLSQLGIDIATPEGKLPRDHASKLETVDGVTNARAWPTYHYHWAASASRHYPLRFEEVNAERYGYTCSRTFQPALSAAHFFGTIPYLPYLIATECPRECNYTLGHYRSGNCNPWRAHGFPCEIGPAGIEGAAVAGLIFLVP